MKGQKFQGKHRSPTSCYSEVFKRQVVREFEAGYLNKRQLARKYDIPGKATVLKWCRKYGKLSYPPNSSWKGRPMKDPQKQRIKELENALENEKLKVIAYEKLLEIIEREDGINLLKKDAAKQFPNLPKDIPKR